MALCSHWLSFSVSRRKLFLLIYINLEYIHTVCTYFTTISICDERIKLAIGVRTKKSPIIDTWVHLIISHYIEILKAYRYKNMVSYFINYNTMRINSPLYDTTITTVHGVPDIIALCMIGCNLNNLSITPFDYNCTIEI